MLTNIRGRGLLLCLSWINHLLSSQAFDLSLADALDAAGNVVDSHSNVSAIKTRACNGEQLAALCMTGVLADTLYGWHDLDSVAGDVIEGARLNRACIIHSVSSAAEECGHRCSCVPVICLDRARDEVLLVLSQRAIRVVKRAQVNTDAIDAKVDWQVAGVLVLRCFSWIEPNRGGHTRVDDGWDKVVDDGSVVPVVGDLAVAVSTLGAGQLLCVYSRFDGQVHLDLVQALEGVQRHATCEEGADGRRSVHKSVVDWCGHELVIF